MRNNLIDLRNPWICLLLKLWNNVIAQNHLKEVVKVLRWCTYDSYFVPNKLDVRFRGLVSQGQIACRTFLLAIFGSKPTKVLG